MARGREVLAACTPDDDRTGIGDRVMVPGVVTTPTTAVTRADGAARTWRAESGALAVDVGPEDGDGTVLVLRDVRAG